MYAEKTSIPVAWTLLGIGAMPEDHPLAYGYMGMHGWKHVNRAIQSADLLFAIGMRFDESRGLELPGRLQAAGVALPPFVGMRGARTAAATSPQVFDLPMWALGARDVIDFGAIPDNETGNRHIAERLARCVE